MEVSNTDGNQGMLALYRMHHHIADIDRFYIKQRKMKTSETDTRIS